MLIPWDDERPWVSKTCGGMLLGSGVLQLLFWVFVKKARFYGFREHFLLSAHSSMIRENPFSLIHPLSLICLSTVINKLLDIASCAALQNEKRNLPTSGAPGAGAPKFDEDAGSASLTATPSRQQLLVGTSPVFANPVHPSNLPSTSSFRDSGSSSGSGGDSRESFAPVPTGADGVPVRNPFHGGGGGGGGGSA